MGIKVIRRLPTLEEATNIYKLTTDMANTVKRYIKEIEDILEGRSDRFLIIVGPCSADNVEAVKDYTYRLAHISEQLKDKLFLVPRLYTAKPRSIGPSYHGMVYQPDPTQPPNLNNGLLAARMLHHMVLSSTGMVGADEFLYPEYFSFVEDLVAYVVVGARSCESPQHRFNASGLNQPVGVKNPINGNLQTMINAVKTISQSNHIFINGYEALTDGNPYTHCVLRGYVNKDGTNNENYGYSSLLETANILEKENVPLRALLIDASHSNSNKDYRFQTSIIKDVLKSRKEERIISQTVKGVLLESYIHPGSQLPLGEAYGVSISDSCMGFEETKNLLFYIAENI